MKESDQEQQIIKKYLLGGLDDQGQQQVEERIFTDQEYKEQVLMVEHELVEDYAAGILSETEQEKFACRYLSTPRQRRTLRITEALGRYATAHAVAPSTQTPATRPPVSWWRALLSFFRGLSPLVRFSLATLTVVALAGVTLWLIQVWRSQALYNELARINSSQNLRAEPEASVFQVTLTPVLLRSKGEGGITIPKSAEVVRLRLELKPEEYQSYQASLQTVEGREIFKLNNLQAITSGRGKVLVMQIPVRLLTHGDYLVRVSGFTAASQFEEVDDYPFSILNR